MRPLYFVCTMILSQPLEKVVQYPWCVGVFSVFAVM